MKFMLLYAANDKKIKKILILSINKQRQSNKIKSQYYITNIKDPWLVNFQKYFLYLFQKFHLFFKDFFGKMKFDECYISS